MPQNTLTQWLSRRTGWKLRLAIAWLGVAAAIAFALFGVILRGAEAAGLVFSETLAGWVQGIFMLVLLGILAEWANLVINNCKLDSCVKRHSMTHPEEHDALEAAVELEQKSRLGPLRPFEQEYLELLQKRYAAEDFALLRASPAFALPRPWPLALAILAMLLLFLFVHNPVQRKAWQAWFGRTPGIEFIGLPDEIERHRDLTVTAKINRHGGQATLETRTGGGAPQRFTMQGTGEMQHLTLYDVVESTEIRARTPYVKTRWKELAVYDPPSPNTIALDTEPPAYSKRKPQHLRDFSNLEVLDGELLRIQCEMPAGQTWELRELTAEAPEGIPRTPVLEPDRDMRLQACYHDAAGHRANGPAFTVTVRPDLPPNIELIEPKEDATCKAGQKPLLQANVTDDFGVAAVLLHCQIDNGDEITQIIYNQELSDNSTAVALHAALEIGETELKAGQLVTGWLEAVDNRTPESRHARSELFFLTVTPDESSFEGNLEGMEGGEVQEVQLTDLILESKRLIRNTFDLLDSPLEPPVVERLRQELERDLRALELSVRARSVDLAAQLGLPRLPEELLRFFTDTAGELVQAATDVAADAVADSRAPQQTALVTLVQLNNLLMENMMKMSGGEGQGTPEPGEKPGEAQDQEGATKPEANAERQQQLEQLHAAHAELQKILQEQRALLDELRRANRIASAYAEPEKLLAKRTRNVAAWIAGIAETMTIQDNLRQSWTELDNAGLNFATLGNQETAAIHARRAEKTLQDSLTQMEELLQQLASRQMEKLGEDARKLGERQRGLSRQSADFTRNPPDEAARQAAREQQEALAQETAALRERIDETARAMERENPAGSRQLRGTLTSEENAALQRAQSRARNALTYRRYETAASEQSAAATQLEELATRLEEAAARTGLSPEELQRSLEEAQRLADEAAKSQSPEALDAVAQAAAELASQTGRRLGNDALQQLGNDLAAVEEHYGTTELLRTQLVEKITSLREELREELRRQLENTTRRHAAPVTAPPRQYRQEVEEYFRRISE